ncbi:hypothetical protein ACLKMY_00670 [Paraburkholderia mimosarum]|uniref:hypothetical protein n=1 Tax=Paraburkholderia mimosarum TaxID=312026 RepID=UPI0039C2C74F
MASVESILQFIVDRPGATANEIADELDMAANDVQSRLAQYIDAGKVKKDKKRIEGGREMLVYFPGQSLVNEVDGVKRIVTLAKRPRPPVADSERATPSEFTFGFFSDGSLSIGKGNKDIRLTRAETSQLLEFLDCINIEKIAAG